MQGFVNTIDLNDYEKLDPIGKGGFGEVFELKNKKTGEILAAKISIKMYDLDDPKDSLYIQREIGNMCRLNHPSILRYHGFSKTNFLGESKPVIIMEYATNKSVHYHITHSKSGSSPEWNSTKKLICLYGVASAMQYLHSLHILHRDLKPDNILLNEKFYPKLSDFGLAKQIHFSKDSMTLESDVGLKGTVRYCAPEIFEDSLYSESSDVYAFGMIAYEIMTGETPFKGLNFFKTYSVVVDKNQRPEFSGKSIGHSYQKLIEQCWSQNPDNRPTFENIVKEMKTNKGFITEDVNEDEYQQYIQYLESSTLNSLPDKDDADALFKHGLKLYQGEGVSMNKEEACRYFKMAADKGHSTAMHNYAAMLWSEDGVPMNKEEASRYFKMAADNGDIDAIVHYALMLYLGEGVAMNKVESCRYYKMAADKGHLDAMNKYGYMLSNDEGVPMNKEEASRYYKMAADKGYIDSMNNYARMLENGDGVEKNVEEAIRYFKMAAEKGHLKAMFNYGNMLYQGKGVSMNKEEACRYYKMAAEKGQKESSYNYAFMLSRGEGVEMNKKEAARYYKIAADKGDLNAMNSYGCMLEKGEGVEKNVEEAIRYFKLAADKGHILATINYQKHQKSD